MKQHNLDLHSLGIFSLSFDLLDGRPSFTRHSEVLLMYRLGDLRRPGSKYMNGHDLGMSRVTLQRKTYTRKIQGTIVHVQVIGMCVERGGSMGMERNGNEGE